jgi:hypothetical protein
MKKNINKFIQKFKLLLPWINSLLSKFLNNFKIINRKKFDIKIPKIKFNIKTPLSKIKIPISKHLLDKFFNIFKFAGDLKIYNFKKKNLKISNFNKVVILSITIMFGYLFYLTIPNIYNKLWVQKVIEKKLINEFDVNFNLSSEISYIILPSPHFLIKNATIIDESENEVIKIADIKKLKVFISQKNFFKKDKLSINEILIEEANFIIKKNSFDYITNLINKQFSTKIIEIKKSNFFLKDLEDDTLLINKINNARLFYNFDNLQNSIFLNGELFNIPFQMDLNNDLINEVITVNAESRKLKLKLNNELIKKKDIKNGITELFFLNTKLSHEYVLNKSSFNFKSKNSMLPNNMINYNGQIDLEPFSLNFNIDLEKLDFLKIVNRESIIIELIKSEIFFNQNVDLLITLRSPTVQNHKILRDLLINFNVDQGTINLNQSKVKLNKFGLLKFTNSNVSFIDGELVLNGNIQVMLEDSKKFYQFLQTPKKNRRKTNEININFDLNIQKKELQINTFLIDDLEPHEEIEGLITAFNSEKIIFSNFIELKNFINRILIAYEG